MPLSFLRGLVLLILLCGAAPVSAASYYASTSGGGSTCSFDSPCSLQGGITRLSSGDTLYIRGGTYTVNNSTVLGCWTGAPSCPASGTASAYTTIRNYGTEVVTLAASPNTEEVVLMGAGAHHIAFEGLRIDGTNTYERAFHIEATNIRLSQLDIFGSARQGIQVACGSLGSEILNSKIHDNGTNSFDHGIYAASSNLTISGNDVYNNSGWGIHANGERDCPIDGSVLKNNRAFDNVAGSGIIANTGTSGQSTQIYNNVVYGNGKAGIEIGFWTSGHTYFVYGNTAYNNTAGGILIDAGTSYTPSVLATNNILYQNAGGALADSQGLNRWTATTNLCGSSGSGCAIVGNPGFNAAGAGDFHILAAGSPAVNAGTTLSAPYNVDAEGVARPSGQFTVGAYQFQSTPVGPFGNVARYTFEEGTGTTAADSEVGTGAGGHTCTLNTAGWGAGIIGTSALNLDGTRWCQITGTADLRPTTQAGLSAWINATSTTGSGVAFITTLQGDAFALWVRSSGVVGCQAVIAGTFYGVEAGSVLSGTNRHVSCSYKSGDGLRLRLDNVQIGFLALSGSLDYSLGTNAQIGRSELTSGLTFIGRIDQVYLFDQEITAASNTNLFNELVPIPGVSVTHQRYATADAVEGVFVGALDADYASVLTAPLGLRWAVHKSDTGSLTEYFRIFCRTFVGGVWGSWTEVGNTLGTLGVRFYVDSVVNRGDATTALLPLDGFTAVAGKIIADTVDLTSPYDAIQRVTISQSQHLDYEARLSFGAPLIAGDKVQCKPYRENGTDFGASNYANIKELTLQGLAAPSSIRLGGQLQGGVLQ